MWYFRGTFCKLSPTDIRAGFYNLALGFFPLVTQQFLAFLVWYMYLAFYVLFWYTCIHTFSNSTLRHVYQPVMIPGPSTVQYVFLQLTNLVPTCSHDPLVTWSNPSPSYQPSHDPLVGNSSLPCSPSHDPPGSLPTLLFSHDPLVPVSNPSLSYYLIMISSGPCE